MYSRHLFYYGLLLHVNSGKLCCDLMSHQQVVTLDRGAMGEARVSLNDRSPVGECCVTSRYPPGSWSGARVMTSRVSSPPPPLFLFSAIFVINGFLYILFVHACMKANIFEHSYKYIRMHSHLQIYILVYENKVLHNCGILKGCWYSYSTESQCRCDSTRLESHSAI